MTRLITSQPRGGTQRMERPHGDDRHNELIFLRALQGLDYREGVWGGSDPGDEAAPEANHKRRVWGIATVLDIPVPATINVVEHCIRTTQTVVVAYLTPGPRVVANVQCAIAHGREGGVFPRSGQSSGLRKKKKRPAKAPAPHALGVPSLDGAYWRSAVGRQPGPVPPRIGGAFIPSDAVVYLVRSATRRLNSFSTGDSCEGEQLSQVRPPDASIAVDDDAGVRGQQQKK
ncbi:hypothetical protein BC827DRAFT_1157681 [Russula dissimulans]|nr:hypothetical protein BC827DRAFT_1157681 [Russula dissimulans]